MGKSCRVKYQTRTFKKRGKVFCKKVSEDVNDVDNKEEEAIVNIVNNDTVENTPNREEPDPETTPKKTKQTVSERKVEHIISATPKSIDPISGYRIIDIELLNSVFKEMRCPECTQLALSLNENVPKKMGLASSLYIECSRCLYKNEFFTSTMQDSSFDVNKRMVYTMRSCGQGYAGIEKFTMLMDMPKPMTGKNYNKLVQKFVKVTEEVAKETMEDAVKEIRQKSGADCSATVDTAVSQDGTWQRRGYASLNGCVVTILMDTGKVIDAETMSRYCKGCSSQEKLRLTDPVAYDEWKVKHKCNFNYRGSAGGMEVESAKRIFSRSIQKYNVRYTELYGDGDSKSHEAVADTYNDIKVKKLQCVGHVQKRVGARLLSLKKRVKGLGGRGKLTQAIIDRLQNYYGIAIRQNVGELKKMQDATRATLFHVASSEQNNYHTAYCPEGKDSWCLYQQDQANKTHHHKPGPGLPMSVITHVKPIFADLSSEKLLKDCLHGKTQNHNESFNGTIWERLPKSKFVTLPQLKFGVNDAIANFNIGRKASVLVYKKLNMVPGQYMLNNCKKRNRKRLSHSVYKDKETSKIRRKIIRGNKKKKHDRDKETEGTLYKAGSFA